MVKRTHVVTSILEKSVFEKYDTPAGLVELPEGSSKPEGGRLVGWRTDVHKVRYQMPIEEFKSLAERLDA